MKDFKTTLHKNDLVHKSQAKKITTDSSDIDEESETGKSEDNACHWCSEKPLDATKHWKQERCCTKIPQYVESGIVK